jgi:nitroreductase
MDVRDAVATRFSCRAFLDRPVAESTVREILERASRAPSGGNVQPWHVHVVTGEQRTALIDLLRPRFAELPRAEGAEYDIFPPDMTEPYKSRRFAVGAQLYQAIDIPYADRAARLRQYARNFELFGAPVGLFFAIDRHMGPPQWSDLGMYMQTVMLLARAYGLHTCPQEAWTHWHKTLSAFLNLPAEHILFSGMALGYGDEDAPINRWQSPREPLDTFARLTGE